MWNNQSRDQIWSDLDQDWDLIIVGGGITGAGILREATRLGLRALLVEANDFAGGTSSRSSKLVHGGFRYLKNGQVKLTYESVRERERLLHEGRGLVNPLGFLLANFDGDAIPGWVFGAGLVVYDLLAFQWGHRRYDAYDMRDLCPVLNGEGLQGGFRYFDAQTDDARLVLRLIEESVAAGGVAINYVRAAHLLRTQAGQVLGVALEDRDPSSGGRTLEVKGVVVINATGAWADELRREVGGRKRLRMLRGSHLIFSTDRLPLTRAVSYLHPRDGRPVFAFPWEGVTLIGTTDVDQDAPLSGDAAISAAETEYLLEAAQRAFPCLSLSAADIQATFAGVRPVIGTGKTDPSKESREHVLWQENGLLTVAGGKLTTFRLMAQDALHKAQKHLVQHKAQMHLVQPKAQVHLVQSKARARLPERNGAVRGRRLEGRLLDELPDGLNLPAQLTPAMQLRLAGRHGANTPALVEASMPEEMQPIHGSTALWAELRWAARAEAVVHLDDLLLRRVRLGLTLPSGGIDHLEEFRRIAQPELGWDDARWQTEAERYTDLWKRCYH